jgi:hypothetical protein
VIHSSECQCIKCQISKCEPTLKALSYRSGDGTVYALSIALNPSGNWIVNWEWIPDSDGGVQANKHWQTLDSWNNKCGKPVETA